MRLGGHPSTEWPPRRKIVQRKQSAEEIQHYSTMFMRIPKLADGVSCRGPTNTIKLKGKVDTAVLSGDGGGGTRGRGERVGLQPGGHIRFCKPAGRERSVLYAGHTSYRW